jgi:hypothetical protein
MKEETLILDKSQSPLRWVVLVLGCVVMIANYYCYDNPAALKTNVRRDDKLLQVPPPSDLFMTIIDR